MANPIFMPNDVKESIRQHLADRYPHALEGFDSANEEEDALTGDLGSSLRARNRVVIARDNKELEGEWVWSMNYKKVRGRGPHPTENIIGADGIFELTVQFGKQVYKKSLLFQAKINWKNDPNLFEQVLKLSNWREAAFVLNFKEDRIEAINLDAAVSSQGRIPDNILSKRIDQYIGEDFLNCDVGNQELYYDTKLRVLRWENINGDIVSTPFSIRHYIGIHVASPQVKEWYGRKIETQDIFNNRMNASPEEILSLGANPTKADIRKAQALMARTYHSDLLTFDSAFAEQLATWRMQEINSAAELLKQKAKDS